MYTKDNCWLSLLSSSFRKLAWNLSTTDPNPKILMDYIIYHLTKRTFLQTQLFICFLNIPSSISRIDHKYLLLDTLAAAMLSNSLFRFCNKSRLPNGQHQYPKLALNQCWNTLSGGALLLAHKPDLPVPIDTFYHVCCLDGKPRFKIETLR